MRKVRLWIGGLLLGLVLAAGIPVVAQQVINLIQIGGASLALGQTTMSASLPVTVASNQTAVPVSGTVTANAGTGTFTSNVSQFGGSNVVTGTGASGSGIPRVTLSNDSSLAANQSVNVAQVGGASLALGVTTSANSVPVVLAADSATLGTQGQGTITAAVPVAGIYEAGNGSGKLTGFLRCDSSVVYDTNTNGKTQLVALVSSKVIYVCGVSLSQSTTTAVTVSLGSGTGTNCGTTYTAKTPAWPLQAPTSVAPVGLVLPVSQAPWFQTATSEELCISTNAAVSVQALVSYTQF